VLSSENPVITALIDEMSRFERPQLPATLNELVPEDGLSIGDSGIDVSVLPIDRCAFQRRSCASDESRHNEDDGR
jgi:hypothetical protein